jgi:putative transposase
MAKEPLIPVWTDTATLTEVIDCLTEHLEIPMPGSGDQQMLFEILGRAASQGESIEQTCQTLDDVPNGNAIRYHLEKLDDLEALETRLNQALHRRLPPRIRRGKRKVALDLNLLPYYGTPSAREAPYIYRSQAKAGPCSFSAYATVSGLSKGKRVTIALHAVRRDETLVRVITRLLDRVAALELTIKRLYVDRGFFSVPVIRWLHACGLAFVMLVIIRGKAHGTRALLRARRTYKTCSTMQSPLSGSVTFEIWVVGTYWQGKYGRHGVEYQAYAVSYVALQLRGLPDDYRKRFGIESSYRLKHQSRIRTTTKNPVVRLLYVGIAFLLVDLWVFLVWMHVSHPRKGARLLYTTLFSFQTMLRFLRQAIDRHHPVREAIYLKERNFVMY